MVKKIIDLADSSTFTAGAAAQVIIPSESLNLPYLVDYLSGQATTPSRTIPIADLLNTPTTKVGVFGGITNITTNGSRVFTSTSKFKLTPYNTLQFFANKGSDDTWGDEPDSPTTFTWSKFSPSTSYTPILQNYGIQTSNAGDNITTVLNTWVYFPTAGQYTFKFATDNNGYISLDGNVLLTTTADTSTNYTVGTSLTGQVGAGYHKIVISLTNVTGPMGVAAQILNSNNVDIWHTAPGRYGTTATNESIFLQYSKDGIFWSDIKEILPADIINPNEWYLQTVLIPADAKIQEVYLRIFQVQDNPDNNFADNWAVSSLNAIPVGVSALLNFNDPDSYIAGDATQASFPSDIANGISQYFNGTSQYFTVEYNSKFNFGADDFTVELWLNMSSAQTAGRVINAWNGATGAAAQWEIVCGGGNAIQFNCGTNGTAAVVSLTAGGLTTGTWYHVVGSRTGNIFALFVNGIFKATTTQAITLQTADTLTIGARRGRSGSAAFGGSMPTFLYLYSTNTLNADPGEGALRFNNTSLASSTLLYINKNDLAFSNAFNSLSIIDSSTSGIKGYFKISVYNNNSIYAIFNIVGSLTDNGSYVTVPISFLSIDNALSSIGNNNQVVLTFANSYIEFFNGYVTNVRIVSGRSLYRTAVAANEVAFSGHTPGPLALTAVDNTVLLACQNYTNIDNSTTKATITNVGSTAAGIVDNIIISPLAPQVVMPAVNPYMSPCRVEGYNRADIRIGILGRYVSINADKVRWFRTKDKVSLRGYTGLRFYLNKGNNVPGQWGDIPDTAQAETDGTIVTESFLVQYSADGSTWTTFSEITPASVTGDNQWYVNDITIPDAIKDSTIYLRYNMNQAATTSGTANDNWAVSPLFALADMTTISVEGAYAFGGTNTLGPLDAVISPNPIILG